MALCTLSWLGFVPDKVSTAPPVAVARLADQLGGDPVELRSYGRRAKTRTEHLRLVAQYLGWRPPSTLELKELDEFLLARAMEHDSPTLLFRLACEYLISARVIRPGPVIVVKRVAHAREEAQRETFARLAHEFTDVRCAALDGLLVTDPEVKTTRLRWLATGPVEASPAAVKAEVAKLAFLRGLGADALDLSVLPAERHRFLATVSGRLTAQALERRDPQRRYPILLTLLAQSATDVLDEVVDLFDQAISAREGKAERPARPRRGAGRVRAHAVARLPRHRAQVRKHQRLPALLGAVHPARVARRTAHRRCVRARLAALLRPATYLLTSDKWSAQRMEFCQLVGKSADPARALAAAEDELGEALGELEGVLAAGDGPVRLDDGGDLVISPLTAEDIPAEAVALKAELTEMLPFAPIVSLLIELDKRTGFLDCFTHAGGKQSRSPELKRNLIAVLISHSTNLGLTRMADACGISYDILAWTAEWYVREETLRAANLAIGIRDLGKITLYRTGSRAQVEAEFPHTEPLLTRKLNTDLIADHYDDLLRVAGSLKFGRATASLLVGKLSASGRQNALAAALKEYGALRRTIYAALMWNLICQAWHYGSAVDIDWPVSR